MFPHGEESFTGSAHDVMHEVPSARTSRRDARARKSLAADVDRQHLRHELRRASARTRSRRSTAARSSPAAIHNTGEGGISPYHKHGADLIYQIGTGYFGCRDSTAVSRWTSCSRRSTPRRPCAASRSSCRRARSRARAACCPAARSPRRSRRSAASAPGEDCISPNSHSAFADVPGLHPLRRGDRRGDRPARRHQVGGRPHALLARARRSAMNSDEARSRLDHDRRRRGRHRRGAAGLRRSRRRCRSSVGFTARLPRVPRARTWPSAWSGSARRSSGFPIGAIVAICLGADMINIAREAMLAIGCIQAQQCHTGHCPTGVATHERAAAARARCPSVQADAVRALLCRPSATS